MIMIYIITKENINAINDDKCPICYNNFILSNKDIVKHFTGIDDNNSYQYCKNCSLFIVNHTIERISIQRFYSYNENLIWYGNLKLNKATLYYRSHHINIKISLNDTKSFNKFFLLK